MVDLLFIIFSPANITKDFLQYGPVIEHDIFSKPAELTGSGDIEVLPPTPSEQENPSGDASLTEQLSEKTGFSPDFVKGLLIFGGIFLVLLLLSGTLDGSSSEKKK